MTPEVAVGAGYFAIFIRPGVPEFTVVLFQQIDIRFSREKPEILDNYIFPGNFSTLWAN